MWHLYALTHPVSDETDQALRPGIANSTVIALRVGDLLAFASEHEHPPRATREAALAHVRLVEQLLPRMPTLPVRYGSTHSTADGLRDAVLTSHQRLRESLSLVGGHAEFALRALAPKDETSSLPRKSDTTSGPGGAYLRQRRDQLRIAEDHRHSQERILEQASAPLTAHARRTRSVVGRGGRLERCFLVPLDQTDEFRGLADRHTGTAERLRLLGPFPPFSFATGELP